MSSLYDQFERLNRMHIEQLDSQSRKQNLFKYNAQFVCNATDAVQDVANESELRKFPFAVNQSCVKIDTDYSLRRPSVFGYDADDKRSFHHQPEVRNTFHNYLVTNDVGDLACTMNHQYFNNWTRRHTEQPQAPSGKMPEMREECIPSTEVYNMRMCTL